MSLHKSNTNNSWITVCICHAEPVILIGHTFNQPTFFFPFRQRIIPYTCIFCMNWS